MASGSSILAASASTLWFGAWIALASTAAFVMHGFDKRAAIRERRRVPEARLHLLELIGGWPGAILAMLFFRHKVRKATYLVITAAIVALWVGVGAWLLFGR
jgi:uncharacterized membrane protein YsdA (DUF1294 family)